MVSKWFAVEEMGSFFRLNDDTLQALPMLENGNPDSLESTCDVEWECFALDGEDGSKAKIVLQLLRQLNSPCAVCHSMNTERCDCAGKP